MNRYLILGSLHCVEGDCRMALGPIFIGDGFAFLDPVTSVGSSNGLFAVSIAREGFLEMSPHGYG